MIISFDSKELRKICEEEQVAIAEFGNDLASRLHSRLADLVAVKSVTEIPVGLPAPFEVDNYKVNLQSDCKLIFCAASNVKRLENGYIDWSKVDRIKILEIKKDE